MVGLGLGLMLITMVITLVARNLAARARAADVLHAERERFRTTLTSIGDAVVVTDAQGRITLLNPVAQSLTRWGDEAIGQPLDAVFRIVNESTHQPVENPVSRVIRSGAIVGLTNHTELIAKDGTEMPIDDSGAPIRDARGRIVGVVLVFRDITERRGAERVLQDADRRKDEFLAMLAHELRNPLAPIRNAAHTLALLGPGDDRLRWVAGVIERQVGLMTRLVDDLLDVSRITSGKIALQREAVSVRAVLAQAVEAARPAAESRTQALEMDVPEDAGWVDGDPARLAQAVGQPPRQRDQVHGAGRADPAARAGRGGRGRDRGRGHRRRASIPTCCRTCSTCSSRPTARSSASRAGSASASPWCAGWWRCTAGAWRRRARARGTAAPSPSALPRLAEPAAEAEAAAEPAAVDGPAGPARRILVVDDEPDSTDSLALFLRLRGHEVRTAHDGPSALDEIDALPSGGGVPRPRAARDERLRRGAPGPDDGPGPAAARGPHRLRDRR